MARNHPHPGEIGEIGAPGAAPDTAPVVAPGPQLAGGLPERPRRAVFGEVHLDRLPRGLRDVQQEINRSGFRRHRGRSDAAVELRILFSRWSSGGSHEGGRRLCVLGRASLLARFGSAARTAIGASWSMVRQSRDQRTAANPARHVARSIPLRSSWSGSRRNSGNTPSHRLQLVAGSMLPGLGNAQH